ncbi:multicopper oxidase domain-containing protein [Terrabacter sp. LjRoot27]|uniref:multicopper oxidase domain-containing protein n=1 Tax=Terrabacter sp. LjRoot27 TaxID=3342306 RepID=UPI003ECF1A05
MTTRTRGSRVAVRSLLAGGALTAAWLLLGPTSAAHAADRSFDLYATTGTTSFNGASVGVWGYSPTGAAVTAPGGPVLTVDVGDDVTIHLHNQLAERTSLYVGGQQMVPDTTGAAAGTPKDYTFKATRPGTYLYEAGLTANNEHQVAMGLYGALVVRGAPDATTSQPQAYGDAASAYDTDAVLVLSQFDPAMSASPATFDMRTFKPRYSLVNGKVHPQTAPIPATAGQKVLLRYVNAGVDYRSMGVLGASQHLVGVDGSRLKNGTTDISRSYVAETFGPGQTADAVVTAPVTNGRLPVYDASLALHNSSAPGLGGMLTSVVVTGAASGPDTSGPVTSGVAWAGGTVTATVSDATTGGGTVAAAEARLDSVGGAPVTLTGAFGSPTATVSGPVGIASGQHVVYVRGQDAAGNWGQWSSVLVSAGDATGPTTSAVALAPATTNGAVDVSVTATANDTASGGTPIAGAEFTLDGGGATAMTLATQGTVASLEGTIPATIVAPLSEGTHTVSVRSRDASNNWGAPATATFVVDKTGPAASGVSVTPDPNNGLVPLNQSTPSVRLSATVEDTAGGAQSPVVKAEAFVDTLGPLGAGIPMEASDGAWSSTTENVYLDIPLATVRQMTEGAHHLYVRGKDAAGNWGAANFVDLHVDKTGPVVASLTLSPNPTGGAASVMVTGTATDTLSALAAVEYFRGTDPGVGNGTPLTVSPAGAISGTIDANTFNEGATTLSFRAKDAAGNWGAVVTRTLTVSGRQLYYSTAGSSNPPGVGGTADDADIYRFNGTAHSRLVDMSGLGVPTSANVDGYSRVDDTHFYVSFSGTTNVSGFGTVQDEDVIFRNGTSWQLFFDGSTHNLTANVDGVSVVGSGASRVLYLSLATNTTPPGAGGAGDDADIYRWTSGSTYTRVVDASTVGIPAAANVDGVKYVGSSDYYLSFSSDASVTGLGTAADEDVIHRTGTAWSTYFDGSVHGLNTSTNLDVDAFDIP